MPNWCNNNAVIQHMDRVMRGDKTSTNWEI
jgi:hypothetical protein